MIKLPTVGPTRTSAINSSKIEYVDLNANPIQGCSHGCRYCYARKIDLQYKKVETEDDWHDPKFFTNFFDLLERELENNKIDRDKEIFLSTMTDLYQPYAVRHGIGRKLIEMLQDYGATYRILTKSPSIVRDLDLHHYPKGKVGMSITTDSKNDSVRKNWEPNTVSISKRLEALGTLKEELSAAPSGNVWVSAEPFLPGTNFDQYFKDIIYSHGGGTGLGELIVGKMNYVAGTDLLFDWPDVVKIIEKYRQKHSSIRFHYKKEFWGYLEKNQITPVHLKLAGDEEFCYNVKQEQTDLEEWF